MRHAIGVVDERETRWASNLGVGDWNPHPDRLTGGRQLAYLQWLSQLNPVLSDFEADFPGRVRAVWNDNGNGTLWDVDGAGTSISVDPASGWSGDIAMAQVLDALVEAAWEVSGDGTWPACPWHPRSHPLAWGSNDDGDLSWVCPRDHEALARVGELAAARAAWTGVGAMVGAAGALPGRVARSAGRVR
jgi:hypothetical protein